MTRKAVATIEAYFGDLPDPRIERGKRHQLIEIIVIAICAVICGAENWPDVEAYGRTKTKWFKRFLKLENGIPSHDTFWRVFRRLDAEAFEQRFMAWVQATVKLSAGEVVAIDGKTVRRSHDREAGRGPIQLVSAWAEANQLVLGQVKVKEGSNEVTAIPELLEVLTLKGCIVTMDAAGCHEAFAETIVEKGGEYVLALKANQARLYEEVKSLFAYAQETDFQDVEHDYSRSTDKGHGRIEIRECWVIADPEYLAYVRERYDWRELKTIVMVVGQRRMADKTTTDVRYYVSSLPNDARLLLRAVRGHWSIENSLHWVLDMVFREDESRLRQDNGAHNFAILRRIALNLLKQEPTAKRSLRGKRLKAAWDDNYLLKVLLQ